MNAYEYGNKHYGRLYQPKPNIVVFNDKVTVIDDLETSEEAQNIAYEKIPEYYYLEVKNIYDNYYSYYDPKPEHVLSESYVEGYLIPNGYFVDIGTDNEINNTTGPQQIYAFEGKYYFKYLNPNANFDLLREPDYNNEVIINSTKSKFMAFTEEKLKELLDKPELKLTFFFTTDGVKLEDTYQSITDVRPDEIIFFLEKDDAYNVLGSVTRILSGKNITKAIEPPVASIFYLADFFNVDIDKESVKKLIELHLLDKSKEEDRGSFYYVSKAKDEIIKIKNIALNELGIIAQSLGDGISSLTFDDIRWKYYNDDGSKSSTFSPIFPGLKQRIDHLDDTEKEQQTKTFDTLIEGLDKKINEFFAKSGTTSTSLGNFLDKRLGFLKTLSSNIKTLYDLFKKIYTEKNLLIYINALFIGLMNSLIKAVGGIISLVGMIFQLPYKLDNMDKNKAKSSVSAAFELLENFIETVANLFSEENIEAMFNTFKDMGEIVKDTLSDPEKVTTLVEEFKGAVSDKINDAVDYVSLHMDKIGYGLGFAVGFIIEEVVTAIYTGGAKNIASALKFTVESYASLFRKTAKVAKRTLTSPIDAIKALGVLLKQLRKMNVKEQLDNFLTWFKKLFRLAKDIAEEAFKRLFPPSTRSQFKAMKLTPTRFDEATETFTFCPIKI